MMPRYTVLVTVAVDAKDREDALRKAHDIVADVLNADVIDCEEFDDQAIERMSDDDYMLGEPDPRD